MEFIYSTDQLEGVQTQAVYGEYIVEKAVIKLLEGTKLQRLRSSPCRVQQAALDATNEG
jgi:hypothetical protein